MIDSVLLPEHRAYIEGIWRDAESGDQFSVLNPATGELLTNVPKMGAEETGLAIQSAQSAMEKPASPEQRQRWLAAIHDKLLEHKDELARIITLEHGKPLKEARVEVEYSAGFFRFFATQIGQLATHRLPGKIRGCDWNVHFRPAGVAGSITPWNFPLAMMAKKLAPALGAGCAVVAKPASLTPLSAIAYVTICQMVGLPAGMINLVIGRSGPIGDALCTHPAVRIISFTGSTEVGQHLAMNTAPHIKRLALELGGNAPFIVCDDADLETAADELMANKFRASGQTCVCTNRVYVQRNFAEAFTKAVAARTVKLQVGNGLDPETDIGPLINRDGWDKVDAHVKDALANGATRLVGEDPARPEHDWGAYYPPTVLSDVAPGMRVCREETFGPVVAISQFAEEAEVLSAANATEYGLAAYLFTADEARAERMSAGLQFGHVGVNTGTGPAPEAPFGGMKQSGYGREGGLEGLLEFCEPQVVVLGK